MQRKLSIVVGLAVLCAPFTVRPVYAQARFGVAAGLVLPTGSMADAVNPGYNITASLSMAPSLSPVGLRFDGMFNEFDYKSTLLGSNTDRKQRVVAGIANAVITAPAGVGPYLLGGLWIYNVSCSGCGSTASQSNAGFNAGGGYRFGLSGFSAFIEARYHYVTGDTKTRILPLTFGVTF
jgi:hypothetical protein